MNDLHEPKFTIAQIASAADVQADTIRQWYKRGVLSLHESDREAAGDGLARHFSGATCLMIAIMGALIRLGTAPGIAEQAAGKFVRVGDGDRYPGHLYPNDTTLLAVSRHEAAPCRIYKVNLASTKLRDVFNGRLFGADGLPLAMFLELDELVDRVRLRLGLGRDPRTAPRAAPRLRGQKAARAKAKEHA